MTSIGEKAIITAMKNGTWDTRKPAPVTDSDLDVLKKNWWVIHLLMKIL